MSCFNGGPIQTDHIFASTDGSNVMINGVAMFNGSVNGVNVLSNQSLLNAHVASTTAHGVTGVIVGTSESQVLTNKTITDNTNNVAANSLKTTTTPITISSAVRPTNINQVLAFNGTQGSWVIPNHNALTNYVSNQHVDHNAVSIITNGTSGISGGGDISASRTLALNLNGLTTVTTNGTDDFVPIYSVSGVAPRKITLQNLTSGTARALATTTTPLVVSSAVRPTNINQVLAFNGTQGSWVIPNHNALTNYVSNQHIDHSTVSIITNGTSGISGGGNITASRTLSMNITGMTATTAAVATTDSVPIFINALAANRKSLLSDLPSLSSVNMQTINSAASITWTVGSGIIDMTGITLTTSSTKSIRYLVMVQCNIATATNNRAVAIYINVGGVDSATKTVTLSNGANIQVAVYCTFVTAVIASGTIIKVRWNQTTNQNNITTNQQNLSIIGLF